MVVEIEKYIMLFFIYSFAGWLMESLGDTVKKKKFINRGFLIGPYCPIYGCGVILITILLQKYSDDIFIIFFMSILISGILEYSTSYLMEKIFKARWWDYSERKFNINGRICLETLIPFGIAGTFILYVVNPFLLKYIEMIPSTVLHIISGILVFIYILDLIVSFKIILNLKEMTREFKDNTIEISDRVKKIIKKKYILYRRLVKAFPKIKESVLYSKWDDMKKKIEESKEEIMNKIDNSKKQLKNKIDMSKSQIQNIIYTSKESLKKIYNKKEENK